MKRLLNDLATHDWPVVIGAISACTSFILAILGSAESIWAATSVLHRCVLYTRGVLHKVRLLSSHGLAIPWELVVLWAHLPLWLLIWHLNHRIPEGRSHTGIRLTHNGTAVHGRWRRVRAHAILWHHPDWCFNMRLLVLSLTFEEAVSMAVVCWSLARHLILKGMSLLHYWALVHNLIMLRCVL